MMIDPESNKVDILCCTKCGLLDNCQISPVPTKYYEDKTDSSWTLFSQRKKVPMCVVLAPSRTAEFLGEPLDILEHKLIQRMGLHNFFAASLVRCPGKPKSSELSMCNIYFSRDMHWLKPTHVFAFGKPTQARLDKMGIGYVPFPALNNILNASKTEFDALCLTMQEALNEQTT